MKTSANLVAVLALCLCISIPAANAENWVYRGIASVPETESRLKGRHYIDVDSIRIEDGLIRYWTKDEIYPADKPDILRVEKLVSMAVNCKHRTFTVTASVAQPLGEWAWIGDDTVNLPPEKWQFLEAIPGSLMAGEIEYVCSQQLSQTTPPSPTPPTDRTMPQRHRSQAVPPARAQKPIEPQEAATGSGIIVSKNGHVLTNYHVISTCVTIRVRDGSNHQYASAVVAKDQKNDLSLIKSETQFTEIASFRTGTPIRPGDRVVALGYPLAGLLASEVNVSIGNVSTSAGIADDTTKIQISAPVQPGNSGGPLLDDYGNVVGVVVGKLNAIKVAKLTGDVPQNVNFAIKGEIAQLFLNSHKVSPQLSAMPKRLEPAEIAARGRSFTVLVECLK